MAGSPRYDSFSIPVDGGDLFVGRWIGEAGAPTVVAAHGITGNHTSWQLVADTLGGRVTLVAPDHRGRGKSNTIDGPFGMAAHAADLIAILDHLELEAVVPVGHSMGGYVVATMAELYPDRVGALVLVDGGIPLPVPPGLSVDEILQAVIGPARARLEMTFESQEAYRDFWRAHPAIGPNWSPAIQAYVDYDLTGEAPKMHSTVSLSAIQADGEDTLVGGSGEALSRASAPTVLLRAENGMMGSPPPLLPDEIVPDLEVIVENRVVRDVNHYTIALSPNGAAAVAEAIEHTLHDVVA